MYAYGTNTQGETSIDKKQHFREEEEVVVVVQGSRREERGRAVLTLSLWA